MIKMGEQSPQRTKVLYNTKTNINFSETSQIKMLTIILGAATKKITKRCIVKEMRKDSNVT